MSAIAAATQRTLGRLLPPWWLFLLVGISWMIVALIVLRFDYTSVNAISILFGIVAIVAGLLELGMLVIADGWWKLLYGALAVAWMVLGVVYSKARIRKRGQSNLSVTNRAAASAFL